MTRSASGAVTRRRLLGAGIAFAAIAAARPLAAAGGRHPRGSDADKIERRAREDDARRDREREREQNRDQRIRGREERHKQDDAARERALERDRRRDAREEERLDDRERRRRQRRLIR